MSAVPEAGVAGRLAGWAITFLGVMIAWVVFRADSMTTAIALYKGMLGLNGVGATAFGEFTIPYRKPEFFHLLIAAMFICLALPQTITLYRWIPHPQRLAGHPALARAATVVMALLVLVLLGASIGRLGTYSPFLYFQF